MSQINLDNVAGLVPREAALPDRGRVRGQPPGAESFGDHFWRVQASPKETVAGGQPDSAPLSQPPALPPDAPQPFTQEREPAADDPRRAPQDSADVDSDENAAGLAAAEAASEDNRAETAQTQCDADDRQPSETAEPGSQTRQEQATDADPGAHEAKQVDPQQAPAKPSPHQPKGQVGKGVAGQSASDLTSTDQAEKGKKAPPNAASKKQAAEASPPAQTLPDQAANQADPSLQRLGQQNAAVAANVAAATSAQAADKTAGQPTDNPGSRNRSAKKGAEVDKPSGRQQNSPKQVSQPGAPLPAPLPGAKQDAPGEPAGRHGKQQPGNVALAAAAASRAATEAAANQPATSEDEQTSRAGDPKLQAPEDPAKPPPTAVPDGRLNAPLRISPSLDPRVAPTPQPQQAGESVDADRARFVQRVARAFQAVGKSSGSIRLRLSPPELGSLRLEITVRNGLLTARVEAETPTARNLLLDNLPALRERLAQQDIKVKQFDVALMDRSPGGSPEQMADQTHSQRYGGSDTAPQRTNDADRDAKPVSAAGSVNRPGEGTQLNVVI